MSDVLEFAVWFAAGFWLTPFAFLALRNDPGCAAVAKRGLAASPRRARPCVETPKVAVSPRCSNYGYHDGYRSWRVLALEASYRYIVVCPTVIEPRRYRANTVTR